jgi:hypothetical protein
MIRSGFPIMMVQREKESARDNGVLTWTHSPLRISNHRSILPVL